MHTRIFFFNRRGLKAGTQEKSGESRLLTNRKLNWDILIQKIGSRELSLKVVDLSISKNER
jgi:hypothetical protein